MHYYSCETRQLLLRIPVNLADENRTIPTEINRCFIYFIGQILFHCNLLLNLGFTNAFEYLPKYQKPFHNFLRKHVTLGQVVLKF